MSYEEHREDRAGLCVHRMDPCLHEMYSGLPNEPGRMRDGESRVGSIAHSDGEATRKLRAEHPHRLWRACLKDRGRETGISENGPEGALLHGLEQFRERDAQRSRQAKQVLEGRVPASGLNPAQIGPVHLGQFRQALLGQTSLAAQLPDVRRQQFHRFLFGSQTSSVFCCRLLVYRILVTIACRIDTPETLGISGSSDYCATCAA